MSEQMLATNRSVRARRGTKMAALIAGAAAQDEQQNTKADDEFWSQAFFQDAADDAHYSTESESADEVDDDFFDPENQNEEEEEEEEKNAADDEKKKKKKRAYVDPRGTKAKKKKIETTTATTTTTTTTPSPLLNVVSLRGTTKQRTDAIKAEMVVREAERERRRRISGGGVAAHVQAPPLTQEQRLLEAKITERQNQAELARLTALHDDMRLQRAAAARRQRHIVGPVLRVCSRADGAGTTLAFTHPNIDPLFERRRAPVPAAAAAAAQPTTMQVSRERRRVEAAQQAADVLAKVEQLRALLATSLERAQRLARRPLPAALAAPLTIATSLSSNEKR